MRKITPIAKCEDCRKKLTLSERAFNDTLCDACQWRHSAAAYQILAPIVRKMKFVLLLALIVAGTGCTESQPEYNEDYSKGQAAIFKTIDSFDKVRERQRTMKMAQENYLYEKSLVYWQKWIDASIANHIKERDKYRKLFLTYKDSLAHLK